MLCIRKRACVRGYVRNSNESPSKKIVLEKDFISRENERERERERERGREREGVRDTPNEKPSVGNELFRRRVATTAKGNALLTRN